MHSAIKILVFFFAGFFTFAHGQVLPKLTDKKATKETQKLYANLWKLLAKGIMFGHQDDLAYGVNWRMQEGRSDVKETAGDFPAVFGWDVMHMESDGAGSIDIFSFVEMKKMMEDVYDKGGINTISWHAPNPMTGKDAWDNTKESMKVILPGAEKHDMYKMWLDKIADYLVNLRGKDGQQVPILFRPYHELTGGWFWWGKGNATPEDFKTVWQFTIDYLRNEKQVHNLIIVYNTSDFQTKDEFMEFYPGDEYVDMISFDMYLMDDPTKNNSFVENAKRQFRLMDEIAKEHHKIPALAETGFEAIPYEKFWTKTLMDAIGDYKISYVLAWRNHGKNPDGKMHYYVPHKGHPHEKDFKDFYNLKRTLFLKDISKKNIYK